MANHETPLSSPNSDSATTLAPPNYRPPSSHTVPILHSLIQTTSFLICPLTQTLYLPIPHPTLSLSLTLPNPQDLHPLHRTLNDPLVAFQLEGPPYPYTEEQAREWIKSNEEKYERILGRWIEKGGIGWDKEGCPVGNVRLGEGAGGRWVGDLGVVRKGRVGGGGGEDGDGDGDKEEDTVWSFGFFLDPQYHRQGIMAAALKSIIENYLIPVLKARHIRSCAFEDNWGSRKTQEKCGMRRLVEEDHQVDVAESRGGGKKVHVQFQYDPR